MGQVRLGVVESAITGVWRVVLESHCYVCGRHREVTGATPFKTEQEAEAAALAFRDRMRREGVFWAPPS